jgi:NitT/TauT family transport system ATP-binding protein
VAAAAGQPGLTEATAGNPEGEWMIFKLQTKNLRMEYIRQRDNSRFVALSDINVEIADKKFVAIVGPSGCGKTTFIKIVDGLIKPTSGEVLIDGRPVRGPGVDRAMVFQEASLLPWRTVSAT